MKEPPNEKQSGFDSAMLMTPSQSPSVASLRSSSDTPRQRNTAVNSLASEKFNNISGSRKHMVKGSMASLHLPKPLQPSKCPLFCCFYAEFDNKVGPTICFQSPRNFMDQEIGMPLEKIHEILAETFRDLCSKRASSKTENSVQTTHDPTHNHTSALESSLSIFDSCSEYIITGNELTGKVINLSTHELHLMTRPTVILDKSYERNSLLFSVGFVLRRSSDPRPFQPIISKLAQTLREMEMESQYLSNPATRGHLQVLTEQLLVSLNSSNRKSNLFISPAYVLHLELFHPPRVPAFPVPDFAVPILLLRDWRQCQAYYDWDLSIDWCARHIDGIRNAKQISEKAEVDMEIVRSCLRVLKHHGVIGLCDMFFYSNRYEATARAFAMLSGQEPKLLVAATEYAMHSSEASTSPYELSPNLQPLGCSPGTEGSGSKGSGSSRMMERHCSSFQTGGSRFIGLPATPSSEIHIPTHHRREDVHDLKPAIAEFYSRCGRNTSFGDLWISLANTNNRRVENPSPVDWRRAFRLLDHRRLVSFGVVHGIIRRVHRFTRLMEKNAGDMELKQVESSPTIDPRPHVERDPSARLVHGPLPRHTAGANNKKLTPAHVGARMDGKHCDDELVCEFQKSFDELLAMVPGRVAVTLAHATPSVH